MFKTFSVIVIGMKLDEIKNFPLENMVERLYAL
jgi:hypothetical protein